MVKKVKIQNITDESNLQNQQGITSTVQTIESTIIHQFFIAFSIINKCFHLLVV